MKIWKTQQHNFKPYLFWKTSHKGKQSFETIIFKTFSNSRFPSTFIYYTVSTVQLKSDIFRLLLSTVHK